MRQLNPNSVMAAASQPTMARSCHSGEPGVSSTATTPTAADSKNRPVARCGDKKCRVFAGR